MTLAGALRDGLGATALRPGNCGPPGQPGAGVTRFIFLFRLRCVCGVSTLRACGRGLLLQLGPMFG
jgi:hypothetical protein